MTLTPEQLDRLADVLRLQRPCDAARKRHKKQEPLPPLRPELIARLEAILQECIEENDQSRQ